MRPIEEIMQEHEKFIEDAKAYEEIGARENTSIFDKSEAFAKAACCRNAAGALLWAVGIEYPIEHFTEN